ncbi:TonB-dependent receptor [Shewanella woodyi]|uniref:TonB-dependent receptor n=1 Tax=Shewanella woodyi (strain ATCC 51908 / MS32) TaxID=392500 RepID=B1KH58_SHEWM|nr:TonB-dependent receptor [Shewanella woodyi]ACA88370.1 TonB-dependent receptor [Shewanella woodyi ATCC 51908]
MKTIYYPILFSISMMPIGMLWANAEETEENIDIQGIEVIQVTARKRTESLQEIPDAVTAFSESDIESARIEQVNDFINLTPNVIFRKTFRAGASFITMRGITGTQQGLPPVTYVVDGVQVGSADFINQDMGEIERIEVLRGPQGALYGAGAMAGAINVITKAPTEELSGKIKAQYAEGNDKSVSGYISGGVSENIFGLVSVGARKSDGLIDSSTGEDLDFNDTKRIKTRWQYLGDEFSADLRLGYASYEQGAVMQDLLAKGEEFVDAQKTDLDDFSGSGPERSFIGKENQIFKDASIKLDYDFDNMTFTWISSYQDAEQDLIGDLDWSSANIFLQDLVDNFDVTSHEVKLTSNNDSDLRWLAGAYYQKRNGLNQLRIRLEPTVGVIGDSIFDQVDVKEDTIKAVFAQLNYDITDKLELTLAGRYDQVDYQSTRFKTPEQQEIVPLPDANGQLQDTLTESDSSFQPKVSLSYDINSDSMIYATYAKGFRPGFYNSGNLTKAETTQNFEVGGKSTWWNNRVQINGAIFYIDYSEQQLSFIIATPPFRQTSNIDQTEIRGLELETVVMLSEDLRFNAAWGYTDSKVKDTGQRAPATPKYTLNLGLNYQKELGRDWLLNTRLDYRAQGDFFLGTTQQPLEVGAKQFVNLSAALEWQDWRFTLYGENITDEYSTTNASYVNGLLGTVTGIIRAYTPGRQIGASVEYKF